MNKCLLIRSPPYGRREAARGWGFKSVGTLLGDCDSRGVGLLPPGSYPREAWIIYLLQVKKAFLNTWCLSSTAVRLWENRECWACPCSRADEPHWVVKTSTLKN